MNKLFGIKSEIWENILLPTMNIGISSNNDRMITLVIVSDYSALEDVTDAYKKRLGDRVSRVALRKYMEMGEIETYDGDKFIFVSSEHIEVITRGYKFNQITLATY